MHFFQTQIEIACNELVYLFFIKDLLFSYKTVWREGGHEETDA